MSPRPSSPFAFVDRFGRRPLLHHRARRHEGQSPGYRVGLSFAFLDKAATAGGGSSVVGIITLMALVVYIASFAFSLGPVVWTVISEIFPSSRSGAKRSRFLSPSTGPPPSSSA